LLYQASPPHLRPDRKISRLYQGAGFDFFRGWSTENMCNGNSNRAMRCLKDRRKRPDWAAHPKDSLTVGRQWPPAMELVRLGASLQPSPLSRITDRMPTSEGI
jgi:hypothetical protein